jgi:hypothetical protein
LAFLLLSAHAQVFEEKVANVSLAFQSTMFGVLHFQGMTFLLLSAHAHAQDGGQCEPGL